MRRRSEVQPVGSCGYRMASTSCGAHVQSITCLCIAYTISPGRQIKVSGVNCFLRELLSQTRWQHHPAARPRGRSAIYATAVSAIDVTSEASIR